MSVLARAGFVAGGAAISAIIGGLGRRGLVHGYAVKATAAGMKVADVIRSVTQTIADEASDVNAEARRQAKIDAAVRERLSELEEGVRAEVMAEFDASGIA